MTVGQAAGVVGIWLLMCVFTVWILAAYRRYAGAELLLNELYRAAVTDAITKSLGSDQGCAEFKPDAFLLLTETERSDLRKVRVPLTRWLGTAKLSELDSQSAADFEALARERMEKFEDRFTLMMLLPGQIFSVVTVPLIIRLATSAEPELLVTMGLSITGIAIMAVVVFGLQCRRVANVVRDQVKLFADRKEEARLAERAVEQSEADTPPPKRATNLRRWTHRRKWVHRIVIRGIDATER